MIDGKMGYQECIQIITKYISMPISDLKEIYSNPKTSSFEVAIISIIQTSINEGDPNKIKILVEMISGKGLKNK